MKNFRLILSLFALAFIAGSCSDDELPAPIATATPPSQEITSGETTAVALGSDIVGTTFSWTVVEAGVSGASAGTGSTIAQTLTATGADSGTATYTVTPTANGMVGNSITVTVTVNIALTTYMADVKPLLTVSCAPCHVAGGTNPNKWDEYEPTKGKIDGILFKVKLDPSERGFMPQGGTKLSDENIAILEKWLADGLLKE